MEVGETIEIDTDVDVHARPEQDKENERDNRYEWLPGNIIKENDWKIPYFMIISLVFSLVLFVIGEILKKYEHEKEVFEIKVWKILIISALVPGVIFTGLLLDAILFMIINIIIFHPRLINIVYYANAFKFFLCQIIMLVIFLSYYPQLSGLDRIERIDKITIFLMVIMSSYIVRNLIINFMMRKQLMQYFYDIIDDIDIYKQVISNISNMDNKKEIRLNKSDVLWKLLKIKSIGFIIWDNNKKVYIHKKERLYEILQRIWDRYIDQGLIRDDKITADNLERVINIDNSHECYKKIMSIFEGSSYGIITKGDFITGIMKMFNFWKDIDATLSGQNNISNVLNYMILLCLWIINLIIFLNIFDIDFESIFGPLAVALVTISFAIAGSVSNVISSIIFIIIMKPFKVHNKISVKEIRNGNTLLVKKIDILTTSVVEVCSGRYTLIPNYVLSQYPIQNLHKSKNVVFAIPLQITSRARREHINLLLGRLENYIKINHNEWKPIIESYVGTIDLSRGYTEIVLWIYHYSGWTDSRIWNDQFEFVR